MRRLIASFFLLALGSVGIACGDVYVDPFTGEQESDAPGIDVPVSDASFPEPPTICPDRMPTSNGPCELPGSVCEYGWSADKSCNTIFRCAGQSPSSYWIRVPSHSDGSSAAAACSKSDCPPGGAAIDGESCDLPMREAGTISDTDELVCNMGNRVCACSTGPNGKDGRRWICTQPSADCPGSRPLIGAPCQGDLWCDYGACDYKSGLVMQCQNGRWIAGGKQCG